MTEDLKPEPSAVSNTNSIPNKPIKLRCPYCAYIFEPHAGTSCPQCKRVMHIPAIFRSETRPRRKQGFAEHRKLDTGIKGSGLGAQVNDFLISRRRSRFLIWVLFLLFMLGFLLIRQLYLPSHPFGFHSTRPPPEERTMDDLQNLQGALELFKAHCGRYPTTEEGLKALECQPGNLQWRGPYIRRLLPDPWKSPYVYVTSNQIYSLLSAGPDRRVKTPDDLMPLYFSATNPPPIPSAGGSDLPTVKIGP
jgi:type II secretion system protein G